jgi:hypothetical protein
MSTNDGEPGSDIAQRRETPVEVLPEGTVGLVNELVGGLVGSVLGTKTRSPSTTEPDASSGGTVRLTAEGYKLLEDLAVGRGKSVSEALSDALRLAAFVHRIEKEDGKLLVERNGRVQELLLV